MSSASYITLRLKDLAKSAEKICLHVMCLLEWKI